MSEKWLDRLSIMVLPEEMQAVLQEITLGHADEMPNQILLVPITYPLRRVLLSTLENVGYVDSLSEAAYVAIVEADDFASENARLKAENLNLKRELREARSEVKRYQKEYIDLLERRGQ